MIAFAFVALAGGVVLLVAGVTGSTIASAAKGKPDHANASEPQPSGELSSSIAAAGKAAGTAPAAGGKLGSLLSSARSQLGVPYAWGGELAKVEFDCSGLVQWSAKQAGITLPRTAQEQFNATGRLSPSEAGAGDLVFFTDGKEISHVGIITAAGRMIDAPHTGANVREESFPQQIGAMWGTDRVAGFGRP